MEDPALSHITDELPELSALSTQDIPTAVRETGETQLSDSSTRLKPKKLPQNWLKGSLLLLGLAAVSLPLGLLLREQLAAPPAATSSAPARPTTAPASPAADGTPSPKSSPDTLLGHFPYTEAPAAELVPLPDTGGILLRKAAAQKLEEMLSAAAADGVTLHVISGFRSNAEQTQLFFDVKAERGEEPIERAAVSAPPGYSEHHTGYAVDMGDSDAPSADLQFAFEQTEAFKWLKKNAVYYSFEMSFPKGNPEGVSYEPWHWRFVGDRQSLELFYRARSAAAPQAASQTAPPSPADAADPESNP